MSKKWQKLSDKLKPEEKPKPGELVAKNDRHRPAEAPSRFTVDAGNLKSEFKPLAEGLTITVEKKTFTITPGVLKMPPLNNLMIAQSFTVMSGKIPTLSMKCAANQLKRLLFSKAKTQKRTIVLT